MAITITRPTAGVSSTANTTAYSGPILTGVSAGNLMIVFVAATETIAAGSMSGGTGVTWTKAGSITYGSGAVNTLYVFWAKHPTGGSTTPTFSCTGDAASGCEISALLVTGYDTVTPNPIRQFGDNTTGVSTVNGPIIFDAAPITTNGVAAASAGALAANSVTPPTGWTEADDIAHATPAGNMATMYRNSGETATSILPTHATTFWGTVCVEIYDSGTGPVASGGKFLTLLGVG